MIAALLLVATPQSQVPEMPWPALCVAYQEMIVDLNHALPAIRVGPPRSPPSRDVQHFVTLRDQLRSAMMAPKPDLDLISRLMRDEQRLSALLHSRLSAAEVECQIAQLREATPEGRRQLLETLRPYTEKDRSKVLPVAPPAPPAPPQPRDPR